MSFSPSRTTEGPHQNKFTLHLGSRTHHYNECNPRRDGMSTHPKVLWSKEENCATNRCQLQRTWSMSSTRWTPNLLCQQIPYRCRKMVCSNWAQSSYYIMGLWEISSFLYGSHFTLQMDQKPLESILAWSLNEATPRLQRLLIKASAYAFDVEYIPGPTNQVADCLSQLGCIKDNIVLPKLRVNAITQQLSNPDDVIQDIRLETAKDDELSLLKHIVTTGWPEWIREIPRGATLLDVQRRTDSRKWATSEINMNYHPKSDEEQVPEWAAHRTPWNHQMHRTGKTDNVLARNKQWHWAICDNLPTLLQICSIQQKMPRKEPGEEIPVTPWTKLGTDIFTLDGANYLLLVDYTFKFPVMWILTSMTGEAVASHFKKIMSEYTWPCTIMSDNGLCYASKEFCELMQQKGVNHILVSPHHPQSNGMAEKYVGIMKQLFLKAREEGKDPADALHAYRSTLFDS